MLRYGGGDEDLGARAPGDVVGPRAEPVQPGFDLLAGAEGAGAGPLVAFQSPAERPQVAFERAALVDQRWLERFRKPEEEDQRNQKQTA